MNATMTSNILDPMASKGTITLEELKTMHKLGHVVIPEYQRGEVWTNAMKREFICSILDREPAIPGITIHRVNKDVHMVDGQQRITAIMDYLNDELTLQKTQLKQSCLNEALAGKFSGLPETIRRDFLSFALDYKVTDNPRKTFLRLQNAKPLNNAERNHALDCSLNACLKELVSKYASLINRCAFDNKRFKAEEVFMGCLHIAICGQAAKDKKDYEQLYRSFDASNNAQAIAAAQDIFNLLSEAIHDRQVFLGAANFRALFLLLHEAGDEMDTYKPYLNEFLKKCVHIERLKTRNRQGEEHRQKDVLKQELSAYMTEIPAAQPMVIPLTPQLPSTEQSSSECGDDTEHMQEPLRNDDSTNSSSWSQLLAPAHVAS